MSEIEYTKENSSFKDLLDKLREDKFNLQQAYDEIRILKEQVTFLKGFISFGEIFVLLDKGKRVSAIKLFRILSGKTLKESVDLINKAQELLDFKNDE